MKEETELNHKILIKLGPCILFNRCIKRYFFAFTIVEETCLSIRIFSQLQMKFLLNHNNCRKFDTIDESSTKGLRVDLCFINALSLNFLLTDFYLRRLLLYGSCYFIQLGNTLIKPSNLTFGFSFRNKNQHNFEI